MANLAHLLKDRNLRLVDVAVGLKVNKGTVSRWNDNGVPFDRLADVSRITGIPAKELRPDLVERLEKLVGG